MSALGVNTTFREMPRSSDLSDRIFPELLGDDDYEAKLDDIRRMIIEDTRARPAAEFPSYVRSHAKRNALELIEKQPLPADREPGFMYKSKLAYRDISLGRTVPTIVRTRTGKLRLATPLEEAKRSWNKPPCHLDMKYHEKLIATFNDPDGDEEAYLAYRAKKKEARKALIANYKASEGGGGGGAKKAIAGGGAKN